MKNKKVNRYHDANKGGTKTSPTKGEGGKINKKKRFNKNNKNAKTNADGLVEIKPKMKRKFRDFKKDMFPGKLPIPKEKIMKYSKGEGLEGKGVTQPSYLRKLKNREKHIAFAEKQAARAELLLTEDVGYLEADDGETTTQFTQKQIVESVDIASAAKHFELQLEKFGPYRAKYSRNGRHLLLGGKMGHVASIDWITKKLHCEMNVMESVHDVCWMHVETMFALAQKDWVYMYDNKGTEIHCLKNLYKILRMEFLPYHFLLATGNETGYLSWLDISIGQIIGQLKTKAGKISVMKQNPYNGVICVGQSNGVVSMWGPTEKSSLASMLCHKAPLSSIAIDPRGLYMATSAVDKNVKVWDIRNLGEPLKNYRLRSSASNLDFSQNKLLSVAMGNVVEVYRDCCTEQAKKPYLLHKMNSYVENLSFCPFEDILGIGTERGFVSLLVPGSGEANFDALECNPYQTKSQRKESEVKALLEKLQPEFICLDPSTVAAVDVPTLKDKVEAHNKLMRLKPKKLDYTPRDKKRKKGSAKVARNKKIVQESINKEFYKELNKIKSPQEKSDKPTKMFGVLDRFVKKK